MASGVSATVLLAHLLKTGDRILCVDDVYGGTLKKDNFITNKEALWRKCT